jgi:hypothetical protein
LSELARMGPARTELHETCHEGLEDERTPMSLELQNMLPGIRMRGREEEGEPCVDRLLAAVQKSGERRSAR